MRGFLKTTCVILHAIEIYFISLVVFDLVGVLIGTTAGGDDLIMELFMLIPLILLIIAIAYFGNVCGIYYLLIKGEIGLGFTFLFWPLALILGGIVGEVGIYNPSIRTDEMLENDIKFRSDKIANLASIELLKRNK